MLESNTPPPAWEYIEYKAAGNILKNYTDLIDDGICLKLLKQEEKLMDDDYLYGCSKVFARLIGGIDVKRIADARRRNAGVLHDMLESIGIPHYYNDECTPLFVPIVTRSINSIRRKVFSENIFCEDDYGSLDEFIELYGDTMNRVNDEDFYFFDRIYLIK